MRKSGRGKREGGDRGLGVEEGRRKKRSVEERGGERKSQRGEKRDKVRET